MSWKANYPKELLPEACAAFRGLDNASPRRNRAEASSIPSSPQKKFQVPSRAKSVDASKNGIKTLVKKRIQSPTRSLTHNKKGLAKKAFRPCMLPFWKGVADTKESRVGHSSDVRDGTIKEL